MNLDSVILISPPYLVTAPNSWNTIFPVPIESDLVYHIRTSFLEHTKVPFFEPKWTLSKEIGSSSSFEFVPQLFDFDSIDDCFNEASKISETVNFLFIWNIEPNLYPNMNIIFEKINSYKKKTNVRILSVIPDAWPRPSLSSNLTNLILSHVEVCDKTITFYEGTIPYLLSKNRKDLADKLTYLPSIVMTLNKKKFDDKNTDFCYIGPSSGAYEHRKVAFDLIRETFPDKSFYVFSGGKESVVNNNLSMTRDYIDKTGDSHFSIVTSTKPSSFLNDHIVKDNLDLYKNFHWPSVHPGRFAECVVSMTVPIYVQFDHTDRIPEIIDSYGACVYVQTNDTLGTIRHKIESVKIQEMKERMMSLYNDHISPNFWIPKLLERT